jgi:hypothetical protein
MAFNEFEEALKNTDEIEITVTGRKSGRRISNPVWFVHQAEKLYLLPVKGSDSDWSERFEDADDATQRRRERLERRSEARHGQGEGPRYR